MIVLGGFDQLSEGLEAVVVVVVCRLFCYASVFVLCGWLVGSVGLLFINISTSLII